MNIAGSYHLTTNQLEIMDFKQTDWEFKLQIGIPNGFFLADYLETRPACALPRIAEKTARLKFDGKNYGSNTGDELKPVKTYDTQFWETYDTKFWG